MIIFAPSSFFQAPPRCTNYNYLCTLNERHYSWFLCSSYLHKYVVCFQLDSEDDNSVRGNVSVREDVGTGSENADNESVESENNTSATDNEVVDDDATIDLTSQEIGSAKRMHCASDRSTGNPGPSKKRRDDEEMAILKSLAASVAAAEPCRPEHVDNDEDEVFGRYVATEIKLIKDRRAKLIAKNVITNAIFHARMQEDREQPEGPLAKQNSDIQTVQSLQDMQSQNISPPQFVGFQPIPAQQWNPGGHADTSSSSSMSYIDLLHGRFNIQQIPRTQYWTVIFQ